MQMQPNPGLIGSSCSLHAIAARSTATLLKDTADSAPYAGPEHIAYIREAQQHSASDRVFKL